MSSPATPPIKTGDVRNRRPLRFNSIDDALAEAQRLADAEKAGNVQYLGNWTVGQILNHIGSWANFAFDGTGLSVAWPIRFMLRFMKHQAVHKSLPAGRLIPKVAGGTLVTDRVATDKGLACFNQAFLRLKLNSPPARHPFFGPMTHQEWIGLNLRHAELHMSFVKV